MSSWLLLVAFVAAPSRPQETSPDPERPAADAPFVVIVNARHPGTAIRRAQLADIFLRRVERWGDGRPIGAADQSLRSTVRAAFSREVLGLTPGAVFQYWQSQIQRGTGLRPPPVKRSDGEVVEWVAGAEGRIGYVTPDASLGERAKAIAVVD